MRLRALAAGFSMVFGSAVGAGALADPVLVSPGATEDPVFAPGPCPTFSWSPAAEAETHELVIQPIDPVTGEPLVGEVEPVLRRVLPGAAASWTPSADECLESGGSYAWVVRADGGAWSAPRFFRIPDVPSLDDLARALEAVESHLVAQAAGNRLPNDRRRENILRQGRSPGVSAVGPAEGEGPRRVEASTVTPANAVALEVAGSLRYLLYTHTVLSDEVEAPADESSGKERQVLPSRAAVRGVIGDGVYFDDYQSLVRTGELIFAATDTTSATPSTDTVLVLNTSPIAVDSDSGSGMASALAGVASTFNGILVVTVGHQSGTQVVDPYELFLAVVDPNDVAGEVEPNNQASTSTPLAASMSSGSVTGSAVDWFSFFAPHGARLLLIVDRDPGKTGASMDGTVEVRGPGDVLLGVAAAGDLATAAVSTQAAGTHYVRLTGGGTGSSYRFVVFVVT